MNRILSEIIDLSHRYGAGTEWVIAGGGNSSIKERNSMWIKSSGTALASITAEQFVEMDRKKLDAIWNASYPSDPGKREARALADLLAARVGGEGAPRPSVETLMHALFPHRLVFHTHPARLNGLACGRDGEAAARRLFGDRHVWIPTVNPGYTLAHVIRAGVERWRRNHGNGWPEILIMQNHGLITAGEHARNIDTLHKWMCKRLDGAIKREPDTDPTVTGTPALNGLAADVAAAAVRIFDGTSPLLASAFDNGEIARRSRSAAAFEPVSSSFSPDHIVYSGHAPCFVDAAPPERIEEAFISYRSREGVPPRIVVVANRGAVALETTAEKCDLARLLFLDTLRVACYAENFGGSLFMPPEQVDFIRHWEVERFREQKGGS